MGDLDPLAGSANTTVCSPTTSPARMVAKPMVRRSALAGPALAPVDGNSRDRGRASRRHHLAHAQGSARRRVDLVPVMGLEDLHVERPRPSPAPPCSRSLKQRFTPTLMLGEKTTATSRAGLLDRRPAPPQASRSSRSPCAAPRPAQRPGAPASPTAVVKSMRTSKSIAGRAASRPRHRERPAGRRRPARPRRRRPSSAPARSTATREARRRHHAPPPATSVLPMRPAAPTIAIRDILSSSRVARRRPAPASESRPSKNFFTPSSQECSCGSCRLATPRRGCPPARAAAPSAAPVRLTGVSTTTRQSRSPASPPRTGRTPLPRMRNILPVCVSGGILS